MGISGVLDRMGTPGSAGFPAAVFSADPQDDPAFSRSPEKQTGIFRDTDKTAAEGHTGVVLHDFNGFPDQLRRQFHLVIFMGGKEIGIDITAVRFPVPETGTTRGVGPEELLVCANAELFAGFGSGPFEGRRIDLRAGAEMPHDAAAPGLISPCRDALRKGISQRDAQFTGPSVSIKVNIATWKSIRIKTIRFGVIMTAGKFLRQYVH